MMGSTTSSSAISLWIARSCFFAALVVRDQLELLRQDRQVREAPLLQLRVVLVGLGEADQVADRPGDDVLVALEVRLVLSLLEGSRQRGRQIAGDRGLLSYYKGLIMRNRSEGTQVADQGANRRPVSISRRVRVTRRRCRAGRGALPGQNADRARTAGG